MSIETITGTITHNDGTTTRFEMYTNDRNEVAYMKDGTALKSLTQATDVLDAIADATEDFFETDTPTVEFRGMTYNLHQDGPNALAINEIIASAIYHAEQSTMHGWEDHTAETYAVDRPGGTLSAKLAYDANGIIAGWKFAESDAEGNTTNTGAMEFDADDAETYLESFAEQVTAWVNGDTIG